MTITASEAWCDKCRIYLHCIKENDDHDLVICHRCLDVYIFTYHISKENNERTQIN